MVYRPNSYIKVGSVTLSPKDVYGIQSILSNNQHVVDVIGDTVTTGFQVNNLKDVILADYGKCYLRRMHNKTSLQNIYIPTPENRDIKFGKYIKKYEGAPYERNPLELMNSPIMENPFKDMSSIFCSELVADMYINLGFAASKDNLSTNNYTPSSFGIESRGYYNEFILKSEYYLGEEMRIITEPLKFY